MGDIASPGTLIVGASCAGVQVAASLRDFDYAAPVTLVGAEPGLPYQRPPLSKGFLLGECTEEELLLRDADFYRTKQIDVITGESIVTVTQGPDGGSATTSTGREVPFSRLVLATGARPRPLPVPGADLPGVHVLRDAEHSRSLRSALDVASSVVVIGGGFIGLEVAATARKKGASVTVVTSGDRLMSRGVSAKISEYFQRTHLEHGVRIHTSAEILELQGDNHVRGVRLGDGSVLPADIVIVGIGADPRTDIGQQLGLTCIDGIVVDEHGIASDGLTLAAGDCSNWPHPETLHGGHRARFESVSTALEQAKVVAASIAGKDVPFRSVPWFWSNQYDSKLQVVGSVSAHDSTALRGDPASGRFGIFYYSAGHLVAAETVNRPADFAAAKSALNVGHTIPASAVKDETVNLRKAIDPSTASWWMAAG
jgi:3-phenylpropionate/trans-cinnamate dioxygenase ferredoxin reductase subunit